jgi:hypothetical protein
LKLTLRTKLEVDGAQHRVLDRMAFACRWDWNSFSGERPRIPGL